MKLREINSCNRPRERAIKYGFSVLNDFELLSLVVCSGTKNENVLELSTKLLQGGFENLVNKNIRNLIKIKGIGIAKASKICAIFEIIKRYKIRKNESKIINSSYDVYNLLKFELEHLEKEHFLVIYLDTKNRVILTETISIGTLNATIIHPREVFRNAISYNSNSIIIAHNHPSGDCEPSIEDEKITKNLVKCSDILGIQILDHIIVGKENYFSFKDSDLLEG